MKIYIFDVRSPEEFKHGYVENSINLPIDELLNRSDYALSVLKDINKNNDSIKVYCTSGARAAVAKSILEFMQYKDVTNMGGLN